MITNESVHVAKIRKRQFFPVPEVYFPIHLHWKNNFWCGKKWPFRYFRNIRITWVIKLRRTYLEQNEVWSTFCWPLINKRWASSTHTCKYRILHGWTKYSHSTPHPPQKQGRYFFIFYNLFNLAKVHVLGCEKKNRPTPSRNPTTVQDDNLIQHDNLTG
jgi:hypothetical protein